MSLVAGYSSDEDNGPASPTTDAFGMSSVPAAKKARIEIPSSSKPTIDAAPHVLAEVRTQHLDETTHILKAGV